MYLGQKKLIYKVFISHYCFFLFLELFIQFQNSSLFGVFVSLKFHILNFLYTSYSFCIFVL